MAEKRRNDNMNMPYPNPYMGTPYQYPGNMPFGTPGMEPMQGLEPMPGEVPAMMPGMTPGAMPYMGVPYQYPMNMPFGTPGMYPGNVPGGYPGLVPGMEPVMEPGMMPGMMPGIEPGITPGMGPKMPPMGQPFTQDPLMTMMPQSYYVIYPEVNEVVNMMETQHGAGYTPTQAEFMGMTNNVADRVQDKIYGMMDEVNNNRVEHDEDHDHGRRRLLFDLVAIILISELFRRRR